MRTLTTLLAAAAILFFMTPLTQAQTATTGQIVGVVTDPSGALVVGAKVAVTSNAGVRRETTTGSNGRFTFPLLDPGAYQIQVDQSGFAPLKLEGVVVQITVTTVADAALKVAGSPTTVSVTGESPLVQTESSAKGTVIDEVQVRDLPLPTRNFQQLLALTTGTSGSIENASELGRGDVPLYVNGQRAVSNSIVINGIDANSIGTGSLPNLAVPSVDSLQEFIVQTSMYDAVQGRSAGGVIAAVTKSGTNKFHGDAYEFFRNTDLDANNFFLNAEGKPRPTYDRNQFGGTLGGPLVKDRAWFFISYQGSRETNGTSLTNSLSTMFLPAFLGSQRDYSVVGGVPTGSLANLSLCYAPLLGGFVDPVAVAALQAKLPNGQYMIPALPGVVTGAGCAPGAGATTTPVLQTIPSNSTYKEDQFNTNLDYKLSNASRLFARFFYAANRTDQALYDTFGDGNVLQAPGWPTEEDVTQRVLSVGVTSVISSRLLNDVRFGWSTIYGPGKPSQPISSSQLGISSPLSTLFPGMPTMLFSNLFTLGTTPLGATNYAATNTYSGADTMTWIKGRHTLKFGGEYKRQALDAPYFDVFPNGEMVFAGLAPLPTPSVFGDFLSGFNFVSVIGSGTNSLHNRANDFSAFFQDDWKITSRLILNLGLRYDYFGPTTETDGHFVGFDPSKAVTTPLLIPGLGTNCPADPSTCGSIVTGGFVQAGNGNLPGYPKVGNGLVNPNYKNFGPRIGFAYQATNSGKVVVRGGYGIFYDRPNMRLYNLQLFNMPYEMLAVALETPSEFPFVQVPPPSAFPLTPSANPTIFPFGGYPALLPYTPYGSIKPYSAATLVPATGIYPDLHDWAIPYVQAFNLGVQWSFLNNWLLDVGYVGSEGRKFPRLFSFNQAVTPAFGGFYPAGSLGGPLFPGFGNLPAPGLGSLLMESNSNSNYNSLQVSVNKRFSKGLQMLLSYTYSHSMDDYSGSGVSDISTTPGDLVNQRKNYATSDFDRRQRLVASYLYSLPDFYRGSSAFGKKTLNSWNLSGIVTLQSGEPFSVLGEDTLFQATTADLATGRTVASAIKSGNVENRLNEYFDTTAFAVPSALGDFGQLGRNEIRGPKQIDTDLSIAKLFPIREGQQLEFRTEFFNLFNNVNWANPVSIASSGNFGQVVSTTTGPRVIQFALKYNF